MLTEVPSTHQAEKGIYKLRFEFITLWAMAIIAPPTTNKVNAKQNEFSFASPEFNAIYKR